MNETEMRLIVAEARRAFSDGTDSASLAQVKGLPEDVAVWLAANVPRLHDQFASVTPEQIAGVALAGLYGPRDAGLIPAEDLKGLLAVARFANPGDARAIERAVVYATRLPAGRGWRAFWPGAWDALFRIVRIQIHEWMTWLATELKHGLDAELHEQSQRTFRQRWNNEIDICAAQIRGALVLSRCFCDERAHDLHAEDSAAGDCLTHTLDDWDGVQPLGQFIWYRAVRERPGHSWSVQEFRRGMLAKIAGGERLAAGETMRCRYAGSGVDNPQAKDDGCWKEVRSDDRCVEGHFPTEVKDLSYRLWLKGERIQVECRRCNQCRCIYFQFKGKCPRCGVQNWSQRLSHAYVPSRHFPYAPDKGDEKASLTGWVLTSQYHAQLEEAIEQRLRDEPHRTFARRFLLHDRKADIDTVLRDLNLGRQAGKRILREVYEQLADILPQPPKVAQE